MVERAGGRRLGRDCSNRTAVAEAEVRQTTEAAGPEPGEPEQLGARDVRQPADRLGRPAAPPERL
jgi:hypothetical protein